MPQSIEHGLRIRRLVLPQLLLFQY